jgi:hypothetical protein
VRIDDLQHLGDRLLLLKRLAQLAQKPRVLYRDDRLVGESTHQFDLPVAERFDASATDRHGADRFALAQQRDAEDCTHLADRYNVGMRVFGIGGDIGDLDGTALQQAASDNSPPLGYDQLRPHQDFPRRVERKRSCHAVNLAVSANDQTHLCIAEPNRGFLQRVENRL